MFCVKIFWSIVRTVPVLTTSIDSPKLSSTSLETIFFTFWEVSVADCDGVLSKPVNYKKKIKFIKKYNLPPILFDFSKLNPLLY